MTTSLNTLRQMQAAGTPPLRDDFQRTALGWRWIAVGGSLPAIHNNGDGKPRGAAAYAGLGSARAAMHWYAPLAGLNVDCGVSLYFPPFTPGVGVTNVLVCADQQLTSYIGVQFDASLAQEKVTVRLCHGNGGPYAESMTSHEQSVIEVGEFENFRIVYSETTKSVNVFHGTAEPLVWSDDDGVVPHGIGYTYTGFSWQGDALTTGPQVIGWEIL